MRITHTLGFVLATLFVGASVHAAASAPAARYMVTRIDSGRGNEWTARPEAINEAGSIAGVLTRWSDGTNLPFVWSPASGVRVLPSPAGNAPRDGDAVSLNDAGQVVGMMDGRPFLWSEAVGTRFIGSTESIVYGINNAGTVAGYEGRFEPTSNAITGFRLHADGRDERLTVDGYPRTMVLGINNNGDAIARSFRDEGDPLARSFVWNADGTVRELPLPVADPRAFFPAVAINDKGWVVGGANLATPDGTVTPLGTLYEPDAPTDSRSMNNAGLVVGYVAIQAAEEGRVFAWSAETGIVGLNERLDASGAGWVLQFAEAVNESGQIAGWGAHNGAFTGFILTPVPEPQTGFVTAAAGLLILRRSSAKRRSPGGRALSE